MRWTEKTITAEGSAIDRFVNGELAACVAGTGKSKSFADINWQFALSMEGPAGVATLVPSEGIGCSVKTKYPELAAGIVKVMTSGSVMDDFHSQVYAMAKITKDAQFSDDPAFEAIYSEQASSLYALPGFVASGSFEETLRGNIQLMLMGEMTAQEVLDETMNYYNDQILE